MNRQDKRANKPFEPTAVRVPHCQLDRIGVVRGGSIRVLSNVSLHKFNS